MSGSANESANENARGTGRATDDQVDAKSLVVSGSGMVVAAGKRLIIDPLLVVALINPRPRQLLVVCLLRLLRGRHLNRVACLLRLLHGRHLNRSETATQRKATVDLTRPHARLASLPMQSRCGRFQRLPAPPRREAPVRRLSLLAVPLRQAHRLLPHPLARPWLV